ncbi:MAG: hypothetical protein GY710_03870 [Desulfobacteraceae bacterium]|nr:hypothetical protein [Desulfobacteraceae bacterium]
MPRIYRILITVLLSICLVYGCSSDGSSEAKSIIKNQAKMIEDYVSGLVSAKSADDVINTIENYTKSMKKLIPRQKEFQKKYPEYMKGKIPEEMKADIKRIQTASGKIPEAMMKMSQYMDSRVQAAMAQMGEEMNKL